jgi:serine beta-lactamase-like protein LACTB
LRLNLFLILTLVAPLPAHAQPEVAPPERYAAAVQALDHFITREVADKQLPALSVALVDDQSVIWAKGYGFQDAAKRTPATAETVYRVGSVSKLFTDLAVMQLVEKGQLDLDAPVTNYLPDFHPTNPFEPKKPITLRQMMAHRSGLVREPPVGNYFDRAGSTLAQMVASLNTTSLVYAPETRAKYSNAAVATVGYVLEKTQHEPFAKYLKRTLLEPMGLRHSAFDAPPELVKDRAASLMWTQYGREFPAPTFALGDAPAGSMDSTVLDLGKFLSILFAGGRAANGRSVKPETLEQMWTSQFAATADKTNFGLGFRLERLNGHRKVGHSGAIYGFSTDLAALPDDKLGAVVVSARDCTNAVTGRIADVALRQMLAARGGQAPPPNRETKPVPPDLARRLTGRYGSGSKAMELAELGGRLYAFSTDVWVELRSEGDALVDDDPNSSVGMRITPDGDTLRVGQMVYRREPVPMPPPPPDRWRGLIGEYGWDHNTLFILEKDGKLHAQIEWFYLYPLTEEGENVFKFPDFGLYHGEKLIFTRGPSGKATKVEAASVLFERRPLDGEDGRTFRIRPERPVPELLREARAAQPPPERGEFGKVDLVELTSLDPTLKLDLRYATSNNFLGTPLYPPTAKAYLQRPAAEAVVRAHRRLTERGYGLLIHDAYRPWSVTKVFWDATPAKQHVFVADPTQGSRHNRGCAVDLTLYDLKSGTPIEMVGGYDEFSDRSYPGYPGGTSRQRWHRDLLRRTMEGQGFTVYEAEWWHFDYRDWKKYPIGNLSFEEIATAGPQRGGK